MCRLYHFSPIVVTIQFSERQFTIDESGRELTIHVVKAGESEGPINVTIQQPLGGGAEIGIILLHSLLSQCSTNE